MSKSRYALARDDLKRGCACWRLAVTLGWIDIRLRYRGSVLGPFWLVLSSLVMVASMGGIYARLFHMVLRDYLPFLSLSLALWQAGLASILQEACTSFIDAQSTIHAIRLPLSLQALRLLVRNAIVFGHTMVVPLGVFLIYGLWPGLPGLAALPGLALWLVDGFAACLVLGPLCARFRDVPPIVGAFLQIAFYITPIIWRPAQLGPRAGYLVLNPFYDLIEMVRAPLLGHWPHWHAVVVAIGLSCLWCMLGFVTFARTRDRLAYWL